MLYDISNERIFKWLKHIFWVVEFDKIQQLSNDEYTDFTINNPIDILHYKSNIINIALDVDLVNVIQDTLEEPEGQLLVINDGKIVGMLLVEWKHKPVVKYSHHSDIQFIDARITGKGQFYQQIKTSNIKMETFEGFRIICEDDRSILQATEEQRYYQKNRNHLISFVVNELWMKHAMDLKQINASLGLADGGNVQSCVTCVMRRKTQNQHPTPQTRNIKIRKLERMIALASNAPRLDNNLFPRAVPRGFTAYEGMKYLSITNMHPKDYIPPTVHMKMGNAGRNFACLKEAIVGKKIMNSQEMKKLHLLQTQLYAIKAEIKQRQQFTYLSEQYFEFKEKNNPIDTDNDSIFTDDEDFEINVQENDNDIDIVLQGNNNNNNNNSPIQHENDNNIQLDTIDNNNDLQLNENNNINELDLIDNHNDLHLNNIDNNNDLQLNENNNINELDLNANNNINNIQLKENDNTNGIQSNEIDNISVFSSSSSSSTSSDEEQDESMDEDINEQNELGLKYSNDQILDAMNGTIDDLQKIQKNIIKEINKTKKELNKHIEYKEWHELTKEAKIKEIEYRDNEILGVDAMKLPDKYETFLPALRKACPEAARIAEYLFPFQGIQFHCMAHKNIVPFTHEFLIFFKFLTLCVDLWSLQFREACTGQPAAAGDKHHWNNHAFHFMEHYKFAPGWMNDQRTEANMKIAMQWFKTYKNHLTESKASSMMLGINAPHLIKFDPTNKQQLYS